jgi:AcrR family transcriptional regulator
MQRRLSPEARRAEIIATAHDLIAEEGYRSLSLREVARRCGMSAPGLMHHFPDMPSLLEAVLEARDLSDMASITGTLAADATFDDVVDAALTYYANETGVRSFDALEAEAIDPKHPAHRYFIDRDELVFEAVRPVIEREFEDPERVTALLRLLADGMRLRHMRDPEGYSMRAQWDTVRDALYAVSPLRDASAR